MAGSCGTGHCETGAEWVSRLAGWLVGAYVVPLTSEICKSNPSASWGGLVSMGLWWSGVRRMHSYVMLFPYFYIENTHFNTKKCLIVIGRELQCPCQWYLNSLSKTTVGNNWSPDSTLTSANRTMRKPCSSLAKQLSSSMTTARVGASSIEPWASTTCLSPTGNWSACQTPWSAVRYCFITHDNCPLRRHSHTKTNLVENVTVFVSSLWPWWCRSCRYSRCCAADRCRRQLFCCTGP